MKPYCLLIACAVLFSACKKSVERYYLTETIKQCVPYQLDDTARFTDGTGGAITLTVGSITDDWLSVSSESLPGSIDSYFRYRNIQFQYRNIKLLSDGGSDGINVRIDEWLGWFDREPHVDVELLPSGKIVSVGFDLSGNFAKSRDSIVLYDSIRIGGQVYYDVVRTQKLLYDYYLGDYLDPLQCYYNKPYGVLQIKENDKVILERLP